MGNLRPALIIGLVFLAYLIWVEWQKDYGTVQPPPSPQSQAPSFAPDAPSVEDIPAVPAPQENGALPESRAVPTGAAQEASGPGRDTVTVTTDLLEVKIDPVGGTVFSARLLDYPVEHDQPEIKVRLLDRSGSDLFVAQSGLLSQQAAPNHTNVYTVERSTYRLEDGEDLLEVRLNWRSETGLQVTKSFIFRRGRYDITVQHLVKNGSAAVWSGSRYDQLQRSLPEDEDTGGFSNPGRYSFRGIAFYSPEDKFEKVDFDDIGDDPYQKTRRGGWLAMIQHYFFAAWIPPGEEEVTFSTQVLEADGQARYIARDVSPPQQVAPGGQVAFSSRLYVGPKLQDDLPQVALGLEHTVNYGIFTVFSKPLFWLLSKIHNFTGNWGWAIVLLTVLIKAAFFKLTEAQYKSTARMRKLQPRIEQLKERYGDDRQRMSQAMMELYKKEKVNPLGGCLPILVQIPIFIALYWVLLESVELRQAPFILWIQNLSARDPYFILPVLNAVFMFATQRLTPMVGMDPLQQKLMSMMPLVFSIMFAFFPAGLVLYWATNAGLSLAQQYYITRKIARAES
ncbi:MAG: membrane protein insertase YidC [Xanthomonadales bacterium]|nr:membrane protein insertase YidC [Xanthomonadales bacterium]